MWLFTPRFKEPYHGPADQSQPALGFVLGKLQAVDVLQAGLVLIHLLTDNKLNTPGNGRMERESEF